MTVTANGAAEAPLMLADEGDVVHVALAGAPEQVSLTVPVNPASGFNCRVNVALCPAVTVAEVETPFAGPKEKSVDVPDREIV